MILSQSIILGIVQGLTEFLPISSSAHLILVPQFLKWEEHTLFFDTALHLGTGLAVILYFWRDWAGLLKNKKLLTAIVVGTIPAGIAGLIFNDLIESGFRALPLTALAVLIGTVIMELSEKYLSSAKDTKAEVSIKDSLLIGFMQMLALVPGMSRSGMTISGGFFRKIDKEAALKFSFYLSAPIIIAAAALNFIKSYQRDQSLSFLDLNFVVGLLIAFIVGLLSIKFMLSYIRRRGFGIFILYRILLVGLILTSYLV